MVSAGFDTQNGITILARALLDEDNAPNRAEALFDYAKDNISFSANFSYLPRSIDEEREESISELRLAAGYKVGQNWTFSSDTRYDITDGRAARAGIGISFDNECTTVHFSAAREFSKAGSASSLTSWNLIASLKGLGLAAIEHQLSRIVGSKYEIIVQDCPSFSIFSFNVSNASCGKKPFFAPAITVNDKSITYYEIGQRETLLKVLKAPGNPNALARKQLIEDRLKVSVAEDLGVMPTEDEILKGMDDFSARARLDTTSFINELSRIGVDEQSFRDFIVAGIAWRNAVQSKFGARSQVSDTQLERTINSTGSGGGLRVLLTEIILPAPHLVKKMQLMSLPKSSQELIRRMLSPMLLVSIRSHLRARLVVVLNGKS